MWHKNRYLHSNTYSTLHLLTLFNMVLFSFDLKVFIFLSILLTILSLFLMLNWFHSEYIFLMSRCDCLVIPESRGRILIQDKYT